jgi:Sec-independent protein translocase protein TatA
VSPLELGLIVLIVLVIAGPRRLTAIARAAASGVRQLRRRADDAGSRPPAPAAHDLDAADRGR